MRPKFRAWDGAKKEMFKDTFAITESGQVVVVEQEFVTSPPDYVFVDHLVIMQSTGIKDKNGKEIFEGDIVKRDGIKRPEVVKFGEWIDVDTLGFEEQYIGFYFESEYKGQKRLYSVESKFNNLCKVIGNIYENQELLEVE